MAAENKFGDLKPFGSRVVDAVILIRETVEVMRREELSYIKVDSILVDQKITIEARK